jgi:hypothetical protein
VSKSFKRERNFWNDDDYHQDSKNSKQRKKEEKDRRKRKMNTRTVDDTVENYNEDE